eukprot:TRINITY_DN1049_c0_g1_i2.p2 TRINITY_DN1049_c0_g1~~TRINITY_DN1049_c0_g1_i2.p2  ORF type:complete len:108 (-),score=19.43 TRINITY_DN1049_c0_g1_i2:353-676(-)
MGNLEKFKFQFLSTTEKHLQAIETDFLRKINEIKLEALSRSFTHEPPSKEEEESQVEEKQTFNGVGESSPNESPHLRKRVYANIRGPVKLFKYVFYTGHAPIIERQR